MALLAHPDLADAVVDAGVCPWIRMVDAVEHQIEAEIARCTGWVLHRGERADDEGGVQRGETIGAGEGA